MSAMKANKISVKGN